MKKVENKQEIFCTICGSLKENGSKFCKNCQKETPNSYLCKLTASNKIGASINGCVQRREISLSYFFIFFGISLTIIIGCISIVEINYALKIFFIILSVILLSWLCFFNGRFRNFIVMLFSKVKQYKEKI